MCAKKLVCYYGSWSVYRPDDGKMDVEDIDPNLCTHAIYAFLGINEDGSVRIVDQWNDVDQQAFRRFTNLKQRNPSLKTLIAIGGWNEGHDELNVQRAVNAWLERGLRPQKLVMGIPTYGRSFTLASTSSNDEGAHTTGPGTAGPYTREAGMLGYNEILLKLREGGWTTHYSATSQVPYMVKGNQWVNFDDTQSIGAKVAFGRSKNLGGFMVWSLETDDFRGRCGACWPLLKAIRNAM